MTKKKFMPIMVDVNLKEKIAFIAKITHKSQHQLLADIINEVFSIAISFDDAGYDVYSQITKTNVIIQFFGKSNMAFGRIVDPSCLGDRTNDILDEKCLQNEIASLVSKVGIPKEQKGIARATGKVKKIKVRLVQ